MDAGLRSGIRGEPERGGMIPYPPLHQVVGIQPPRVPAGLMGGIEDRAAVGEEEPPLDVREGAGDLRCGNGRSGIARRSCGRGIANESRQEAGQDRCSLLPRARKPPPQIRHKNVEGSTEVVP